MTLPKKTSSTSSGLTLGTLERAAIMRLGQSRSIDASTGDKEHTFDCVGAQLDCCLATEGPSGKVSRLDGRTVNASLRTLEIAQLVSSRQRLCILGMLVEAPWWMQKLCTACSGEVKELVFVRP